MFGYRLQMLNRSYAKLFVLLIPVTLLGVYFGVQSFLRSAGHELPLWLRVCCLAQRA